MLKTFENEAANGLAMCEEPDMINTTLDNKRSLEQIIIDVSLFLALEAIRKS